MNRLIFKTLYEYSLGFIYNSLYSSFILLFFLTLVPHLTYSLSRFSLFTPNKKKILAVSIDYDGTFDSPFREGTIWNWIKSIKVLYDDVVILNGSARQTQFLDQLNQEYNHNGSVNKIKVSAKQNHFKFDDFRLQDTWCHEEEEPKYSLPEEYIHCTQGVHQYKLDLIYAQTHHICECYQEHAIDLVFIDDRYDIITNIYQNIDILVPENISLTCMLFDDCDTLKPHGSTLQGKLKFNKFWSDDILDLASPLHTHHYIEEISC